LTTLLEKKIFKDLAMFLGFWPKFDIEMTDFHKMCYNDHSLLK
jgi:hypothetical protein